MDFINVSSKKQKSNYRGLEHFTLPSQYNNVIEHMDTTDNNSNSKYVILIIYLILISSALYLANTYIRNFPMPQFAKLLVYSYAFIFNIPFIIIYAIFLRK
jgi:hypothetical protein